MCVIVCIRNFENQLVVTQFYPRTINMDKHVLNPFLIGFTELVGTGPENLYFKKLS
jgi:hypothetical protein